MDTAYGPHEIIPLTYPERRILAKAISPEYRFMDTNGDIFIIDLPRLRFRAVKSLKELE